MFKLNPFKSGSATAAAKYMGPQEKLISEMNRDAKAGFALLKENKGFREKANKQMREALFDKQGNRLSFNPREPEPLLHPQQEMYGPRQQKSIGDRLSSGADRVKSGISGMVPENLKLGVAGVNAFSETILGASVEQMAFAGGVGLGVVSMFPGIPEAGKNMVQEIGRQAEANSKPVYGHSAFNQSTQGLVFGLNSRRTR